MLLGALTALYSPALSALLNGFTVEHHSSAALDALGKGDREAAREHLRDAQEDVVDVRSATLGLSGAVWGLLPGAGADREDVRRLADASGEAVAIVAAVVEAYPQDAGPRGFLVQESGRVDVDALASLIDVVPVIEQHAAAAVGSLREVDADTVALGWVIGAARDASLSRLEPIERGLQLAAPLLPHLPEMLGADGQQGYLIALLNPAEQRFSGGAALTYVPVFAVDGRITPGAPLAAEDGSQAFRSLVWPSVEGNTFHPPGLALRLSTATLGPSWSTSGEELLRAWEAVRNEPMDGLVAVDIVAIQELLEITGPLDVAPFGRLDSTNLVEQLVGSYEEYTSAKAVEERRAGNAALVAAFQTRLLTADRAFDKVESVQTSARGRHLAVYHRSEPVQRALRQMRMTGDLSRARFDYLGVFNQAVTGHKSDYWQRRQVTSEVRLAADGSARVRVDVTVVNDSPPAVPEVDPTYAPYVRRDNDMALGVFMPGGAREVTTTIDGNRVDALVEDYDGHAFVRPLLHFEPGQARRVTVQYRVPRAAEVRGDTLVYRLVVDPHGLVDPPALDVRVDLPPGFELTQIPSDWSAVDDEVRFTTTDLETTRRWELHARR